MREVPWKQGSWPKRERAVVSIQSPYLKGEGGMAPKRLPCACVYEAKRTTIG